MVKAFAYYRTSSATNVGEDKDSMTRQQVAVTAYAARHGFEIAGEFYDKAVSGADPVDSREGFTEMLAKILSNGCRTILVETASRFARDLMVQESGYAMLKAQGITLIPVDSPTHFVDSTPTSVLIRQILGAVAQFDKAMTVAKLKGARDRASAKQGRRVEGARWMREQVAPVEHIQAAHRLAQAGVTQREIPAALAKQGVLNRSGKAYSRSGVVRMLRHTAR